MKLILIILFAVILVAAAVVVIFFIMKNIHQISESTPDTNTSSFMTYAAIGDSYTIGEGVNESQRWPNLLEKDLNDKNISLKLVSNPSKTGWTTQDVIDRELNVFNDQKIDFATLLIGVNDWVQGVDKDTFRKNLTYIMDFIKAKVGSNFLIVTIPDFGVTPSGKSYGNGRNISEGIKEFNDIIIKESNNRSLKTVDIFDLSKEMGTDSTLVNPDGLHPSPGEYIKWENIIFPTAYEILKK